MPTALSGTSRFDHHVGAIESLETDLLFVPVYGPDDSLDDCPGIDDAVGGEWSGAVAAGRVGEKPYTCVIARVVAGYRARHICFVTTGRAADRDAVRWRRIAAACGYLARDRRVASCAFVVRDAEDTVAVAEAAADGLSAAELDTGQFRTGDDPRVVYPDAVFVITRSVDDPHQFAAAVQRGRLIGRAVNFARALVDAPPNVLTPAVFADRAVDAGRASGLTVDVLDSGRMRELGMGLLLAVAQGSAEGPRMVVLRHEPAEVTDGPVLALVGKGVTFDTGGVSIKPAARMDEMKTDMGGGAAVVAAMCAIAALGIPRRVIGVVPMVENMVGGRAYRPGDVFTGANGKTVEILNTDAEGRLILADALWYAQRLGATHLLDIATLTGHVVVGLGNTVSGLMGEPDDWVETVRRTAAASGERVWPLPIYEEAFDQLKSEVADMTNVGGSPGGAITAAAFLREFTGGLPWAHLDIAGTVAATCKEPYQPKGATGASVRTLIGLASA
jgi:leucyl aminopeptidase